MTDQPERLYQLNRLAALIRPRQPLLDWINSTPELETQDDPLTLEQIHQDCTVFLLPDFESIDDAQQYLQALKPAIIKLELEGWLLDPNLWPAACTPETFDEWFEIEIHSMVFDATEEEIEVEDEIDLDEFLGEASSGEVETSVALLELSRRETHRVWQAGKKGLPLEPEETRLYKAMRQHYEYHSLWDRLDQLGASELEHGGVNPVLHVHVHLIVENHLADNDPPEVAAALRAMLRRGRSRHQAIHAVADLLFQDVYHAYKNEQQFNRSAYVEALKRLIKSED